MGIYETLGATRVNVHPLKNIPCPIMDVTHGPYQSVITEQRRYKNLSSRFDAENLTYKF